MAPTLTLQFLTVVLFFFMIGQGINARDLKVELQDQDQVDSNDKPCITQYGGSKPNYPASYTTMKHKKHISHLEKLTEPYITGYRTNTEVHEVSQPNYITGYSTHTNEFNGPYITAYGKHAAKNPDYITGYKTHTQESNGPYITAYGRHETKQPDSNGPYITQYGKHEAKNLDYITGYKTHTHESNEPYITAYGKHEVKTLESNSKDLDGPSSPNLDRTEAFKVGYFNLDDLYVGNIMTLQFPVQEVSHFLSKKEADSIPLTMSQLPSVLQLFSIPEDSPQAKSMRGSLGECEGETITGETKTCANSLESMLEFVDTIIGSGTKHNILTTSKPSPTAIPLQNYIILEVSHDIDAPKWVACHPLSYPYAIYYCHYIATGTKVFKVSLVGDENGDKIEALGICHLDTSEWNPDHIIFKQLRIKAGKNSPVCHFLPVNHLLWVPMQPSKATM